MKIAIASGKGGTGKTCVATSLAFVAAASRRVTYLDCDVEEPNGAILLKPSFEEARSATVSVPRVEPALCTGCGKCTEVCQYGAILSLNRRVLVFPHLCHGCGGCWLVCPNRAIRESAREIGQISFGWAGEIRFVQGLLNLGEAMSPPLICQVKAAAPSAGLVIIDSPPGTTCPVIESVRDVDYVILVTEPTPFGLHDLKMAVDLLRVLGRRFGVVINRARETEGLTSRYCEEEGIDILARIPDDRRVAEAYSRGELICGVAPAYEGLFAALLARVESQGPSERSLAGVMER
ncbi:MAG: ATP-binding protein [Candidatus Hydrogenedentes bacterium]|nr:ATP-binding protein [Candidatus Hydrogenedentota bacterium]